MGKQLDLIKAEIEKWINNKTDGKHVAESDIVATKRCAYQDVLNFINSLPEEPVSEDLDKAAEEYAYTNWEDEDYHEGAAEGLPFDAIGHTEKAFKAGAKWQRNHVRNIVQQYSEKGYNMSNETIFDENGVYWDGFSDCADGILRELKDE